ncbi:MAG: anti-sigma regulatory factor (Ser/Thr protein kinase) [Planctomycetota bacterium]|jgi:anti-sigma regulatory factor (Ser/Thr protein kinase)
MVSPSNAPFNGLIVEADITFANSIVQALEDLPIHFHIVESAEQALDSGTIAPDLLITGLNLPGVNGLDLVAALQNHGSFPKSILLADQPTFAEGQAAWRLGVTEFFTKPLDTVELHRVVRSLVQQSDVGFEPPASLELSTAATLTGVQTLVREAIAFALRHGVGPASRARLGGAVSEIADNCRKHAYTGNTGEIGLEMRVIDGDEIRIQISDNGCGFDAIQERLDCVGSPLPDQGQPSRGLTRVSALVEGLKLQSSPTGSSVELVVSFGLATFEAEYGNDFSELDYFDTATSKRVLRTLQHEAASSLFSIPPSLAVVLGRLLAGPTGTQIAHATLWN